MQLFYKILTTAVYTVQRPPTIAIDTHRGKPAAGITETAVNKKILTVNNILNSQQRRYGIRF